MKAYLYSLAACALLLAWHVNAADANTNEWGTLTNNIQMSISLEDRKEEIKPNQPVMLLIHFRNVSSNEIFQIYSIDEDSQFSFMVISPSGKDVSPTMKGPPSGSGQFIRIDPNRTTEMEISLSRLCKFDEIGKYKIVAKRWVDSITTRKPCLLVSNSLNVSVIPDK